MTDQDTHGAGSLPSGGGPAPFPLSDGFGDDLTINEQLAEYDAWLHRRAHQMLPPTDHRHDDLVQEGRIAMWQARERHDPAKGALPAWLTRHANWHMIEVLQRGDKWTGRPGRFTSGRNSIKVSAEVSLEQRTMPDDSGAVPIDVNEALAVVPDVAEEAMWAYHHGEIAEAVAGLTDAQERYVRMRFWEDANGPELREAFGYDPKGLWKTTNGGAHRKLHLALGHLEEEAA